VDKKEEDKKESTNGVADNDKVPSLWIAILAEKFFGPNFILDFRIQSEPT
jgi:hypothetical protein